MATQYTATPFLCEGVECDNEKDAWNSFFDDAETQFGFADGYKIWHYPPTLYKDKNIQAQKNVFVVKGRAVALNILPKGMEEACIRGPYPKLYEGDVRLHGF